MKSNTEHYPEASLVSLLDQTLSDVDSDRMTEHLGTCNACRERLERLAAEPTIWKETRYILSDAGLKGTTCNVGSGTVEHVADQRRLRSMLPALETSDNLDSLGLLDGYEIQDIVGFGGTGVVVRAIDSALSRPVAIKVLHPHLATHGGARLRFAREARAAAAVNHPSVVPIHSVNSEANPPYIVMAYITGGSLQDRLDRDGPLGLSETLRIGCQVASALAAAHAQGLVHRDVKPGNILLDHGQERVLLSDFGLAQALDDASLTASGMIAGTPQYMSPEQARGESVDPRSDIYSLGSVLYAMTTGRPPHRGDSTLAVINKIGREKVRPACEIQPEIPRWWSDFIDQMLSVDPNHRPQTATDVADLLGQCLAHLRNPATNTLPIALAPVKLTALLPTKPKSAAEYQVWAIVSLLSILGLLVGSSVLLPFVNRIEKRDASNGSPTDAKEALAPSDLFWNDGLDEEMVQLYKTLNELSEF